MPLWLFALGALGGIMLISLSTLTGYLLALVWGFIVFPHGAAYLRRRARGPGDGSDALDGVDTHYWRTTDWGGNSG